MLSGQRETDRQKRLCLHFLFQLLVSSLHKQDQSVSCPQKKQNQIPKKGEKIKNAYANLYTKQVKTTTAAAADTQL